MPDPVFKSAARAPNAVLFDLDGTLADSVEDLAAALNAVRAERGLDAVASAELRAYASSGARGLLGAGMGVGTDHPDYRPLRDSFLAHYGRLLAVKTRLFDGIPALLDALDAAGLRWGIVTNKFARFTEPVVAALGIAGRARAVVSGDTTPTPKPHPAPLLLAARMLGVTPAHCVYVGDDLRDILAGNAAGMVTLVARWGYIPPGEDPDAWPASGWLDGPGDVLGWFTTDTHPR